MELNFCYYSVFTLSIFVLRSMYDAQRTKKLNNLKTRENNFVLNITNANDIQHCINKCCLCRVFRKNERDFKNDVQIMKKFLMLS